jgi:glycosyltransferase involved in cell wall biosynthesis
VRVALLTNNAMPPREGIGRHVLETARRLRRRGHDPFVLARGRSFGSWCRVDVEGIEVQRMPSFPIRPFHQHAARLVLDRWLRDGAMGAELLHVHLPLFPPLRTGLPIVATFHSPMLSDTGAIAEPGPRARAIRLNARLFSRHHEQWYLDHAREVIAVSSGVARELGQHYRLDGRPPLVVPNGVDAAFFSGSGRPMRPPVVLYVGRLGYRKGLLRLLEAFALLSRSRRCRLVLVGEGPLEPTLRAAADRLDIARQLDLTGFLPPEGVRAWLGRAACLVNPADYESGPLTLLEAMAAGTPVVSTRTGLVAELPDPAPLLVVEPTAGTLAAGIAATLDDPVGTLQRAAAAQRLVRQRFSWERAVDAIEEAYGYAWSLAA